MRRLLALLAICAPACATQPKMEWPQIPPPEPPPVEPEVAVGGPLIPSEARGREAPTRTVVQQAAVPEIPPDVPRDGKRYLVLRWPLPATGINSLFGNRRDPLDGSIHKHAGVDLEADYGAVVSAAGDGFVVWAGWTGGHGRMVIIEHTAGYQTVYSHLSQVLALPNTLVVAGQAIGLVGNSGRSTGPHLHLEVRHDSVAVDPLDLLGIPIAVD